MTLAERNAAGQEVACYQVAAPYVYANDVDTAVVREDRTNGRWAVEYTLTTSGRERMEALFRDVGPAGSSPSWST